MYDTVQEEYSIYLNGAACVTAFRIRLLLKLSFVPWFDLCFHVRSLTVTASAS
jgi:hypothetical protein